MCVLASCTKGYRIKGTSSISSIDGKTIALMSSDGNEWHTIDSCEVLHGQFQMRGKVDSTLITTLFLDGVPVMPMILEPGTMDITISNIMFKVEGTPLNDSLYNFIARKYRLDLEAIELERMESQMIMNGYAQHVIEHRVDSAYNKLNEAMQTLVMDFIGGNFDNVLSLCGFAMLCNGLPFPIITPLIQSVLDEAPPAFHNHPSIKQFVNMANENMANHAIADMK